MSRIVSTRILPAILPSSLWDLTDQLERYRGLVPMVQIDVCDGHFTPKASWPYTKKAAGQDGEAGDLEKLMDEEEGLPFWQDFSFEIDLMVSDPETEVEKWIMAGAERIIFHLTKGSIEEKKEKFLTLASVLLDRNVEAGLALHLDTKIDDDLALISEIRAAGEVTGVPLHVVQVMGITHVGFQSQPFDERVIGKLQALHTAFPDLTLSVDGAVSHENAGDLADAGATRLVVGHDLTQTLDVAGEISALEDSF
ncbi:MAG: hypothetical protein PHF79_02050 [Candidatus Pacebacteria bacterium]|nr:hypothetical protein [Candidatus Paceibacterota bacterium]